MRIYGAIDHVVLREMKGENASVSCVDMHVYSAACGGFISQWHAQFELFIAADGLSNLVHRAGGH